ncbi:hypothetical protein NXW60_10070 [Bacteroides fragilis]|nr:hypothetical protein NXW60_10070 [Bacteroides fragilis]
MDLEEILGGDGVDQGGDGLGLIDPSDPIEGKQEFVFDISGFMTMLPAFGNYQHYFTIKIVDEKNNTIEKKLTVEIINANV